MDIIIFLLIGALIGGAAAFLVNYFNGGKETDNSQLNTIILKLNQLMATSQERFDAIIARLDTITSDIAADYQKLLDEVRAGGVSDESFAKAEANIATLEALGASVENPVPEPPTE